MGYFTPLPRKIGAVTLVLACGFAAGWVRSLSVRDDFDFPSNSKMTITLSSEDSSLLWNQHRPYRMLLETPRKLVTQAEMEKLAEEEQLAESNLDKKVVIIGDNRVKRDLRGFGFEIYEEVIEDSGYGTVRRIVVPYWSIVIPLTLLSAWLLLSRQAQSDLRTATDLGQYLTSAHE